MACGHCNKSSVFSSGIQRRSSNRTIEECDYTVELVSNWKDILHCIKEKDTNTQYGISDIMINSFLGIVLSAINLNDDICYLRKRLDKVYPYIITIINSGGC